MGVLGEDKVDDRFGNHFTIFRVRHTTGGATDWTVDDSAISAAHLADNGQTAMTSNLTLTDETSGTDPTGQGPNATYSAGDGKKRVRIASAQASGTYIVAVRHTGSAAGHGSFKPTTG
jgi:hypothetical protein